MKTPGFYHTSPQIFLRQMRALLVANLKTRYRNTITGFFWVVCNPIMMFGAQSYAFHLILNLNVEKYLLFLLSGLLPWVFVAQTVDMTTSSLVANGRLIKSFPIHPMVSLWAQIIDNMINFLAAFLIILIPVGIVYRFDYLNLVFLPLPLLVLIWGVFSMAWFLSTAQVFFQDLKFIVTFFVSIGFFFTPIFYPESYIPETYRWILKLNILYYLIKPFRTLILESYSPEFWASFTQGLMVAAALFLGAWFYWRKKRNAVYFNV